MVLGVVSMPACEEGGHVNVMGNGVQVALAWKFESEGDVLLVVV